MRIVGDGRTTMLRQFAGYRPQFGAAALLPVQDVLEDRYFPYGVEMLTHEPQCLLICQHFVRAFHAALILTALAGRGRLSERVRDCGVELKASRAPKVLREKLRAIKAHNATSGGSPSLPCG